MKRRLPQSALTRSTDGDSDRVEYGTLFDPTPNLHAGQSALGRHPSGASAHERQFFRMMQSPPAAFNPLHNLAAFSAAAKGPTSELTFRPNAYRESMGEHPDPAGMGVEVVGIRWLQSSSQF